MPTFDDAREVTNRLELARFVRELADEVAADADDHVENPTTDRYLEALSAWVEDSEQDAAGWPLTSDPPRWSDIAAMLAAAVVYE